MKNYIIRFGEKSNKRGSIAEDSNEKNIQNINNENEVKTAVKASFAFAIRMLNNNVKHLAFVVENYENKCIWNGEGAVLGETLEIISLNKI